MEFGPPFEPGKRTAILGAHSAIGSSLQKSLSGNPVRPIVRRPSEGDFGVDSYGQAEPGWFENCATVVNCVGATSGSEDHLRFLNVEVAIAAACAARDAGVRHFVHISSFSVYGRPLSVDRSSKVTPLTSYGRSKAECDERLLALATDGFAVTCLRLPAVIAPTRKGKMARLIGLSKRLGRVVRPRGDIARSMISPTLTASTIARLAPATGIVHAADPVPFTYAMLERTMAVVSPQPLFVPTFAEAAIARMFSASHWSLFCDCLLSTDENCLSSDVAQSDLEQVLTDMVRAI